MPGHDGFVPDWPRAHGSPIFQGLIKQTYSDFRVTEQPGFPCSGDGEHDFLWLEKQGANTAWVARALARHAGVAARDVGYAGLKDRHATTRQWFSVRRPAGRVTDWTSFALAGVQILRCDRHRRKLKTGAHRGNEFRIAIRASDIPGEAIAQRLAAIRSRGVPNYFGSQRFGRGASNLCTARELFAGRRLKREQRSMALSAARSLLFNEILAARVADGSWEHALPGEALNLDGSGSFFVADAIGKDLEARLCALDVHPTGALWGSGDPGCGALPAAMETAIVARHADFVAGLEDAGLRMSRRPLRLAVGELDWDIEGDALWLGFRLGRGGYATAVLREIVVWPDE